MTKKISQFAIVTVLFSSLAFAGDKNKSTAASGDTPPASAAAADKAADNCPCASGSGQTDKQQDQNKAKPSPTDHEKEFDKVLLGIYG